MRSGWQLWVAGCWSGTEKARCQGFYSLGLDQAFVCTGAFCCSRSVWCAGPLWGPTGFTGDEMGSVPSAIPPHCIHTPSILYSGAWAGNLCVSWGEGDRQTGRWADRAQVARLSTCQIWWLIIIFHLIRWFWEWEASICFPNSHRELYIHEMYERWTNNGLKQHITEGLRHHSPLLWPRFHRANLLSVWFGVYKQIQKEFM